MRHGCGALPGYWQWDVTFDKHSDRHLSMDTFPAAGYFSQHLCSPLRVRLNIWMSDEQNELSELN